VQQLHNTHYQVNLMVSRYTTLVVPSLGLCIGPACEAGLGTGMRREHVPPQMRKKKKKNIYMYSVCTKITANYFLA